MVFFVESLGGVGFSRVVVQGVVLEDFGSFGGDDTTELWCRVLLRKISDGLKALMLSECVSYSTF